MAIHESFLCKLLECDVFGTCSKSKQSNDFVHDYVVAPDKGAGFDDKLLCPKHDVLLCSGIHDLENIPPMGTAHWNACETG